MGCSFINVGDPNSALLVSRSAFGFQNPLSQLLLLMLMVQAQGKGGISSSGNRRLLFSRELLLLLLLLLLNAMSSMFAQEKIWKENQPASQPAECPQLSRPFKLNHARASFFIPLCTSHFLSV